MGNKEKHTGGAEHSADIRKNVLHVAPSALFFKPLAILNTFPSVIREHCFHFWLIVAVSPPRLGTF